MAKYYGKPALRLKDTMFYCDSIYPGFVSLSIEALRPPELMEILQR